MRIFYNWKDRLRNALIRSARTMAQTAIGMIGVDMIFDIVNILTFISTILLSGVACLLMNMIEVPEIEKRKDDEDVSD